MPEESCKWPALIIKVPWLQNKLYAIIMHGVAFPRLYVHDTHNSSAVFTISRACDHSHSKAWQFLLQSADFM